ncbi:helix-turn-helix domain-containing protein [Lactococcus hodotermopsidis]|uniref:helix-turn-helix domain-containing protein n=1 Tax=Pseudolactococcus hodotermopsidis TaxID=2709157 RepID=UPI001552FB27|nr:helix-turn-helix domain-containing protein [Lactococcus hodotermopsidis]
MAQKTVGQVLRDKRAKLDMTLNEAENLSQIQKIYIVALEHDDYEALPGEFYVKAYLKQYAVRLQLDSDKLISAYEKNERIEVEEPTDFAENYRFVKPSERVVEEENLTKTWRYYLPIVLLGIAAFAIVAGIFTAVYLNRPEKDKITNTPYNLSTESKKSSEASKSKEPVVPSTASETPPAPKTEVTITGDGQDLLATVKNTENPAIVTLSTVEGAEIWIGITDTDLVDGQVTLTEENPITLTMLGTEMTLMFGKTTDLTLKIGDATVDLSSILDPASPSTLTINIEDLTINNEDNMEE